MAKLRCWIEEHQGDWLRSYRSHLLASDRDVDADTVDELCAIQQLLLDARLELALYRASDAAGATAPVQGKVEPVVTAPTSTSTH
jgi:hypothetical protein